MPVSASSLARLKALIQPDIDALPDRTDLPTPEPESDPEPEIEAQRETETTSYSKPKDKFGPISLATDSAFEDSDDGEDGLIIALEPIDDKEGPRDGGVALTGVHTVEQSTSANHGAAHSTPIPGGLVHDSTRKTTESVFSGSEWNVKAAASASAASPGTSLNYIRGQLTPVGEAFCPILPISKFPYKYISKTDSEKVADKFFNGGKFWTRQWDL